MRGTKRDACRTDRGQQTCGILLEGIGSALTDSDARSEPGLARERAWCEGVTKAVVPSELQGF